jgi:transcription antitermination factor NusG
VVVGWPIFPSYVFSRLPSGAISRLLQTPGVTDIVKMNGRPAEISVQEIENILRFVSALSPGEEIPSLVALERGDPVRIRTGPFEGVEGVVVERLGKRRVLVGLKSVGLGFEVNVPVRAVARVRSGSGNRL